MKIKRGSERRIVKKGENGVKENIAVEPENRNKTDKPLSPDLLRRIEKIQASHDDNCVIDDQGIRRSLPGEVPWEREEVRFKKKE